MNPSSGHERVIEATGDPEINNQSLEEMKATLKVILGMREQDKKELELNVLLNVSQFAEPYLEKLKSSGLNEMQKGYLDLLKWSLQELLSPFSRELVASETNLTLSETRIANLVRYGKSSKEIAETLNLSIKTIETHRRRIRTKLGLTRNKANLQSYLQQYTTLQKG
jgi:DNA-binding CsgD family transcriptional regulator